MAMRQDDDAEHRYSERHRTRRSALLSGVPTAIAVLGHRLADHDLEIKAITERLGACGLEVHPEKTKIVYCKNGRRRRDWPVVQFDFLGFSFQPRRVKSRDDNPFLGFNPAISAKAAKAMRQTIRSREIRRRSQTSIEELASQYNPVIRGCISYYGKFYRSRLSRIFQQLDYALVRRAKRKYKRKGSMAKAMNWLSRLACRQPKLFAHWPLTLSATAGL